MDAIQNPYFGDAEEVNLHLDRPSSIYICYSSTPALTLISATFFTALAMIVVVYCTEFSSYSNIYVLLLFFNC
jgi:hypothetical protein